MRFLVFFFLSCVIFHFTTPYMTLASISYFLLLNGILFTKNRKNHAMLMSAGVAIDVGLVLILEITRSAIAEALRDPLSRWQLGHILFSCVAVALYLPTIVLGYRAYKRTPQKGKLHTVFGWLAFACRTVGFFLMFSLLSKIHIKP